MSPRADEVTPRERRSFRRGAWAVFIIVIGLLLFTWPFVRTPPLGIGSSYAHLLGSWAVVVVGLALLARALGRRARPRGDRA